MAIGYPIWAVRYKQRHNFGDPLLMWSNPSSWDLRKM